MPPQQNLPGGFAGTGPTMPMGNPQTLGRAATGNGLAAPEWATNWFAMPWWGQPAPNVGAAIMQQMNPEYYRNLRRIQNKRAPTGRGKKKRRQRERQRDRGAYPNPDNAGGYGGFLDTGPFGGRRR